MDEKKKNPFELQMPSGVSPTGPVRDLAEAYMQAVVSLPQLLQNVVEAIDDLTDTVGMMALYAQRKGINEGLLSPDDIQTDEPEKEDDGPKVAT